MQDQFANHSEEAVMEDQTVEELETPEGEQPPADGQHVEETPEEEFDVIRYNKEEVRIPVKDRQTYLQKGYNYDKLHQQFTTVEQQARENQEGLQIAAQYAGFDNVQDFLQAVRQQQEAEHIRQEAAKLGLSEEGFRQYVSPMQNELQQTRTELQTLRQEAARREFHSSRDRMMKDNPDFAKYEESGAIAAYYDRGYSLEDAYKLAAYDDKINAAAREAEQKTLANVTGRTKKQVLSSTDKADAPQFDPANMSDDELDALSARARRGERIIL